MSSPALIEKLRAAAEVKAPAPDESEREKLKVVLGATDKQMDGIEEIDALLQLVSGKLLLKVRNLLDSALNIQIFYLNITLLNQLLKILKIIFML